jgi:hypothetical protein
MLIEGIIAENIDRIIEAIPSIFAPAELNVLKTMKITADIEP